jgi:acetyl-CoA synthetase
MRIEQEDKMAYTPLTFGSTYWPFKKYLEIYNRSIKDPEGFWTEEARKLEWFKTWEKVLDWQPPYAKWFVGGSLMLLTFV